MTRLIIDNTRKNMVQWWTDSDNFEHMSLSIRNLCTYMMQATGIEVGQLQLVNATI